MRRAVHPRTAIEVAAELYHTRAVVRRNLGERFKDVMGRYGDAVKIVAERQGVDLLKAGKILADAASKQHEGYDALLFLAATVELIEPTPEGHSALAPLRSPLPVATEGPRA